MREVELWTFALVVLVCVSGLSLFSDAADAKVFYRVFSYQDDTIETNAVTSAVNSSDEFGNAFVYKVENVPSGGAFIARIDVELPQSGAWIFFVEATLEPGIRFRDSCYPVLLLQSEENGPEPPNYVQPVENRKAIYENVVAKDELAILSRRPYTFLSNPLPTASDNVTHNEYHVELRNINRISGTNNPMNAWIRISLERVEVEPHNGCPIGPPLATIEVPEGNSNVTVLPSVCSGRGVCGYTFDEGGFFGNKCVCDASFYGFTCEAEPATLPTFNLTDGSFVPDPFTTVVPGDQYTHYAYTVPRSGSIVAQIRLTWTQQLREQNFAFMIVKIPREDGGIFAVTENRFEGEALPTIYDSQFMHRVAISVGAEYQTLVRDGMQAGDVVILSILNYAGASKSDPFLSIAVEQIVMVLCGMKGEVDCPRATQPVSIGVYVVPVMALIMVVLVSVLCVTVIVRRRNGPEGSSHQVQRVQRMSKAQIDREFPPFAFSPAAATTGEDDRAAEDQCCICLVDFESGDSMRKLPCEHQYHADCVDRWIATHDSCPSCRAVVREVNESSNSERSVVASFLNFRNWRIGHGRRNDADTTARADSAEVSRPDSDESTQAAHSRQDIETGSVNV
mmetsp:Transcript_6338/g.11307  ORF Transcript_6338/g.11307 Transcript_6338/m.11307 type:complete len:622 (-) Transcript_6338:71-1936(-)